MHRTTMLCVIIALAGLAAADAAEVPTPSASAPLQATAPSPLPIKPVKWQGVTLGENIDAVRERMGKPDFNRKVILGSMLVEYPVHGGESTLLLETSGPQVTEIRVEAAAPKELSAPVGDPFGVNLGDGLTRLLTVRGNPSRADDEGNDETTTTYGGPSENRWIYSMRAGVIYAIALVAPKPPPPVFNGRPGLVLQGTPVPPRRHPVVKGTPSPPGPLVVSHASAKPGASPTATPGPTEVPTPIPGIALPPATPLPQATTTPTPKGRASAGPGRVNSTAPPTAVPTPAPTPQPAPSATPAQVGAMQSSGPTPQPADGSSPQTAIAVRAPDQATGFDYIYKFVENIACGDGSSAYRIVDQNIFSQKGHNYAKVTAECPTTHDRRAIYFDVTYIFTRSQR